MDRHAEQRPNDTAIIWEGDDPSQSKNYTYKELQSEVSRFANVLKKLGVKKGDRVTIYLTMIPEVAFAMLACARIGAIHSVIFGGFAPASIALLQLSKLIPPSISMSKSNFFCSLIFFNSLILLISFEL